jgi:hypothetical protein
MTFEQTSRVITEIDQNLKFWFADYCRRNRTTMSTMLRTLIEGLHREATAQSGQNQTQEK